MSRFSERLKIVMKNKNISNVELADKLGLHTSTILRYKNGKVQPSDNRIIAIADILKVNPKYLLGQSNEIKIPLTSIEKNNNLYNAMILELYNIVLETNHRTDLLKSVEPSYYDMLFYSSHTSIIHYLSNILKCSGYNVTVLENKINDCTFCKYAIYVDGTSIAKLSIDIVNNN